ncbi:MAG: zinc ABC transporter substrate-binding protein [Chloroflexi bacterium]|nr:zinc ABC transporter substrate-binding protein [Chloroflexota bacterium]MBM3138055.1 zinc ABC transporter substrate-binding protein [Chloroflexota bacterium]
MKTKITFLSLLVIAVLLLSACGAAAPSADDRLQVLATTSIVADVVQQVGGEYVDVTLLLPLGTDPHTFEPRPQDAVALAETQIVFANGAGLEEFLEPLLESAGAVGKLIEVSTGIELLALEEHHHEGEETEGEEHLHEGGDPHTWMDPNNVLIWVDNIAAALIAADPEHAAAYQSNAEAYAASLRDLDAWIRSMVDQIPMERRGLVSDHAAFGYFADEYGFLQVGTITGSFSTSAAPSAQELAALEDDIRNFGVHAVFVGLTVNPELAAQVAKDTGVKLVSIYHASLSDANGPAASYLEMMRFNVTAIMEALK